MPFGAAVAFGFGFGGASPKPWLCARVQGSGFGVWGCSGSSNSLVGWFSGLGCLLVSFLWGCRAVFGTCRAELPTSLVGSGVEGLRGSVAYG